MGEKVLNYNPQLYPTSLATGECGEICLNNQELGYGRGYNNAVWSNINLKWQFSCEDEEGNVFWYEMDKYIEDAGKTRDLGMCPLKYIG